MSIPTLDSERATSTSHVDGRSGGTTATDRDRKSNTAARKVIRLFRSRVPFTASTTLLILVAGLLTASLWDAASDQAWFAQIAYGLPSLTEGRWWTPFTGTLFALSPIIYLPMAGSFVLIVGLTEWRLGTRTTALVTVTGHLVGVIGAALVLWLTAQTDWVWAQELFGQLDVGFSAGALAALAVLSATLTPPWRLRLRLGLISYVGVSFLFVGSLADVEHLIAVAVALPLGSRVVRQEVVPSWPGRREWRLFAATGLALTAVIEVVASLVPADGPVGSTRMLSDSWFGVLFSVLVVALIVNAIRHGKRFAWWIAVALATLNVATATEFVLSGESSESAGLIVSVGLLWAVELAVLLIGQRAFTARARRRIRSNAGSMSDSDPALAKRMVRHYGGSNLSWMTTWPANRSFVTASGDGLLAYQSHAGVLIGLGDPIGVNSSHAGTVRDFAAMADRIGAIPALFSAGAETRDVATSLGWRHVEVAQDTIVDLPGLRFRGKPWQDVRSALNRADREGIGFRLVTLAEQDPALLTQVRHLSQDWVADKGLPEMGFTLGGLAQAMDPQVRVGLAVDRTGHLHGMTSWLPVYGRNGQVRGWTLDLMRRRDSAFRPVMEFLIASSILAFQAQGAQFVSLSGAPLAKVGHADDAPSEAGVERLLDLLGANLEPLYGFRSLHAFKTKFSPRYEPMYLAYRDEADLPRIGIAITRAYLPGVRLSQLLQLVSH